MIRIVFGLVLMLVLASCGGEQNTETNEPTNNAETTAENPTPEPEEIKGTPITINGQVEGLPEGKKIFFDKRTIDATDVVANVPIGADGKFVISTGIDEPGIYRLRLGATPVYMVLEGNETVDFTATMDGRKVASASFSGSPVLDEITKWMEVKDEKEIAKFLKETPSDNAWLNAYLVTMLDMAFYIDLYKQVNEQLMQDYPEVSFTRSFNSRVLQTEAKLNAQPVRIGGEAPEIALPNPDGKEMALSDLRGKVVLLDFWASWCKPCRMENPNVVRTYQKYKDKGFAIYSVSLDGLDDRRLAAMQSNPEQVKKMMTDQRNRWRAAIKQDGLTWKHHVSDLRGWSSSVAQKYGVNSIPRTFLLDREGKIRYMNLRGPQLEEKLKELL